MKNVSKSLKLILFLFLLFSNFFSAKASDYYWVGGTGNWSDYGNHWATTSGGVIFHTTTPGPLDNVFFDANSFLAVNDTVNLDSTLVYCKDMNWTGAANSPTLINNITCELRIYGSLTLIPGMEYNLYNSGLSSILNFESGSTGNTIISAGHYINSWIKFSGSGGWMLSDSLHTGGIELINGNLNTNNQPVNAYGFYFPNVSTSNLQLGTSLITLAGNWENEGPATIISASSSTIICGEFLGGDNHTYGDVISGRVGGDYNVFHDIIISNNMTGNNSMVHHITFIGPGELSGQNNTFQKAIFTDAALIYNDNTFDSLLFNKPGSIVSLNGTQTINNLFSANGSCNGYLTIQSEIPGSQATINKASGSVLLNYAVLQDINATGGGSFTANNSVNGGNVTGWTINSPSSQNLYWIGGTGNWSDLIHWSASSGGAGGNCVPGPADNVFFDSNSFVSANDTVYIDGEIVYCKNMNWTGATNSPTLSNNIACELRIYGSLTLIPGMEYNLYNSGLSSILNFESGSTGNTIISAGHYINSWIKFSGSGGWMLSDSLHTGGIELINGNLNTNNQPVNAYGFYFPNVSTSNLQLGTSLITLAGNWENEGPATIISASSSTIICGEFLGGDNHTYGDVISGRVGGDYNVFHDIIISNNMTGNNSMVHHITFIGPGELSGQNNTFQKAIFTDAALIYNDNTFDSLLFNKPGSIVSLNGTQTINNLFSANGSCNGYLTIQSEIPGSQATINKASGSVLLNYAVLQDINATGGGSFTANNSVNGGNVTGWTINSPSSQNLYWIGGTGNWSDLIHWSASSGGAGGNCVPGPADNVFFDSNSFVSANDTVYIDGEIVYCKNMNWTGATNSPTLSNNIACELRIYGSLTLIPGMEYNLYNSGLSSILNFESGSTGNTIISAGHYINSWIKFSGSGGWMLSDSLHTGGIELINGSLNTNNQPVNAYGFYFPNVSTSNLQLGTSLITLAGNWENEGPATIISASSSTIICGEFHGGDNHTYGDVISGRVGGDFNVFHDIIISNNMTGNNSMVHHITFIGPGELSGQDNTFQKAIFTDAAIIYNDNTFDSLIFSKPGTIVSLSGVQTINKAMWSSAMAGFPISFESYSPGTQTTISSPPGNTICMDYLYVQDVVTTGGATFYAGDHSVDLGNNTGWLWSSCSPDTSNVWPGDANYDLTADNIDLLYIGLAYGYTGPARAGASTNWVAQPGIDWLQQFATGYNIKHADCDGNGIVNALDTNAVVLNYGLVHPFKQQFPPSPNNFGTDLYFDMPTTSLVPGSTVDIPIMFGTQINPADKFYGVAFTVNYDPSFIQSNTMEISFDTTWFGNSSNTIHLNKDFYSNGNINMGFVKTDHTDENGYGRFATLHFKVASNASGYLNLSFSKILVLDKFEITQPVNVINGSVFTGIDDISSSGGVLVYPNPVHEILQIDVPGHVIQGIKLINVQGQIIFSKLNPITSKINVGEFSNGIYMLEVKTKEGLLRRKIIVAH